MCGRNEREREQHTQRAWKAGDRQAGGGQGGIESVFGAKQRAKEFENVEFFVFRKSSEKKNRREVRLFSIYFEFKIDRRRGGERERVNWVRKWVRIGFGFGFGRGGTGTGVAFEEIKR